MAKLVCQEIIGKYVYVRPQYGSNELERDGIIVAAEPDIRSDTVKLTIEITVRYEEMMWINYLYAE